MAKNVYEMLELFETELREERIPLEAIERYQAQNRSGLHSDLQEIRHASDELKEKDEDIEDIKRQLKDIERRLAELPYVRNSDRDSLILLRDERQEQLTILKNDRRRPASRLTRRIGKLYDFFGLDYEALRTQVPDVFSAPAVEAPTELRHVPPEAQSTSQQESSAATGQDPSNPPTIRQRLSLKQISDLEDLEQRLRILQLAAARGVSQQTQDRLALAGHPDINQTLTGLEQRLQQVRTDLDGSNLVHLGIDVLGIYALFGSDLDYYSTTGAIYPLSQEQQGTLIILEKKLVYLEEALVAPKLQPKIQEAFFSCTNLKKEIDEIENDLAQIRAKKLNPAELERISARMDTDLDKIGLDPNHLPYLDFEGTQVPNVIPKRVHGWEISGAFGKFAAWGLGAVVLLALSATIPAVGILGGALLLAKAALVGFGFYQSASYFYDGIAESEQMIYAKRLLKNLKKRDCIMQDRQINWLCWFATKTRRVSEETYDPLKPYETLRKMFEDKRVCEYTDLEYNILLLLRARFMGQGKSREQAELEIMQRANERNVHSLSMRVARNAKIAVSLAAGAFGISILYKGIFSKTNNSFLGISFWVAGALSSLGITFGLRHTLPERIRDPIVRTTPTPEEEAQRKTTEALKEKADGAVAEVTKQLVQAGLRGPALTNEVRVAYRAMLTANQPPQERSESQQELTSPNARTGTAPAPA